MHLVSLGVWQNILKLLSLGVGCMNPTSLQGGANLEKNTTPNSKSWFFKSVSKSSKMSFWTWVRKKKSWLRMCGVLERGKCISESYFCGPKLSSAASRNLRLAQPSGKFWTAKIQGQWREIQNSNFDSHFWQENGLISKNSLPDLSHKWFYSPFGDFSIFWAILGA